MTETLFDKKQLARLSPAGFALLASGGRWQLAPHLALLNRRLVDLASGRSKRLLISMPPRHGKSELLSRYFPCWFLGLYPSKRVILTSYESDFAAQFGRRVKELLDEHGRELFGVKLDENSSSNARWDIANQTGGMIAVGMGGALTGRGADLLIIDDPIKGVMELSEAALDAQWEWLRAVALTRLEPGAAAAICMTRWSERDLIGRLLETSKEGGEKWEYLRLPALAEEDDPLGREEGAPLWPERFPTSELEKIRAAIGPFWWSALYQQSPVPRGGQMFKTEKLEVVNVSPKIGQRVRYWDKAGTAGGGAYTAGVLMSKTRDGLYFIEDVIRGQWSSFERNQLMLQTAQMDRAEYGNVVQIWVEMEPGSGGKESAEISIRDLAGFPVHAERVSGSKEDRAMPLAAQCEAGNIKLLKAEWNKAFIDELIMFPRGKYKDQVDAASGAFNKLALARLNSMLGLVLQGKVRRPEAW